MPQRMVSSTSLVFKLCYQEPSGLIYFEERFTGLEQVGKPRDLGETTQLKEQGAEPD